MISEIGVSRSDSRRNARTDPNPFTTVESAQEFLSLLDAAIATTLADVRLDLEQAGAQERRREALRLAVYKLEKLEEHVGRSRRLTNDLRILRRLCFQERTPSLVTASAGK